MNDEQIIKIISDGLLDKNMDMELDDNQIVDIMKAATGHKLQYMMFRYLKKWCANSEWIAQNKRRYIMETFMYKNEFSILPDFFSKLKQNDVQVIGFKGIETCHFLENPYERIMLDVDILVHREDLDKVGEILIGFGYEEAYSDSKIHRTYIHDTFIEIEVHHGLYDSKKREALMGFDQSVWKDTCDFQSHFGEFRIFEIRKNIVYHCVHMTNHFVNGSIDLRQMMDLYYLVNVYIEDNDLMELLEYAASFGLKKYLSVMIFIMYELFELKVDNGFIREMSAEKTYIAKVKHEIVRLRNGDNEYRLDDYRKHLAFYRHGRSIGC